MTHLQNYGSDRLSLYTFGHLFRFVSKWTNLRLVQTTPSEMAQKYFQQNPIEAKSPIWTNPCDDKRHLEILPAARRDKCKNLPDFIILGPQKTGTTALMNFLKVCLRFKAVCSSGNTKFSSIPNLNHLMNPHSRSRNFNSSLVSIMTRDSIGISTCSLNEEINL